MPASINKTKILKFVDGKDPVKGGFLNVAELMHDVVKQMVGNGFVVKHCSVRDTVLNTVPWGSFDTGTWVPSASYPVVGAPPSGTYQEKSGTKTIETLNAVSGGPRATITLEAFGPGIISTTASTPPSLATWVDYLNPATAAWDVPNSVVTLSGFIVPNPADNGATGVLTALPDLVFGKITVGMDITGSGVLPGTQVIGIGTGVGGADGTYLVNKPQTIPLATFLISGVGVSFQGAISDRILTVVSFVTGTTITHGLDIQGSPTPGFDPTDDIIIGAPSTLGPPPSPAIPPTEIITQLSDIGSTPVVTTTAVAALGASTITVATGTSGGILAGQLVEGSGVPQGTFVSASYTTGTSIDLVDYLGNSQQIVKSMPDTTLTFVVPTTVSFYTPGKTGTYLISRSYYLPDPNKIVPAVMTGASQDRRTLLNEAWRVRFELNNNECVTAHVGTALQLPGWSDPVTKVPEPWGIPGSVSKIVDPRGVIVDNAGAVGARQWVASCYTVSGISIGKTAAGTPNTITAITSDGTCTLTKAQSFTQGAAITFTDKAVAGGGISYGDTYYVLTSVTPAATAVRITDTYENAMANTPTIFSPAGPITKGAIAVDATPGEGSGYKAGDILYIKDPILSSTLGYTGTVFIKIDSVNSTGGVLAMTVLDGGALRPKLSLTGAEKTRAPADPKLNSIQPTGSYYNLNTGRYYTGPVASGTTTTPAPAGSGLWVTLKITNAVTTDPDQGPGAGGHVNEIDSYQGFFSRGLRVGANGASYPLKYFLSISNNGFFLGIYESDWATSTGGNGTITSFTVATVGTKLYAQDVLGTITPGMTLQGDARIPAGVRILDYKDPNVLPSPATDLLAGDGDAGVYELSMKMFKDIGKFNGDNQVIEGDTPSGRKVRNPPVRLTGFSGDSRFNWMVVQRPVDRSTGVILDNYESITSKHPVFCLNSVGGRTSHFTVREKDISHPQEGPPNHTANSFYTDFIQYTTPGEYDNYTYRIPSGLNSEDSHSLFNNQNQIALTEDRTYLITFPNNLTTPRFRYTEEIDMIGYTSSDLLMSGQQIDFKTYNESQARVYIAMPPSNRYNTGVRFCVLKQTNNT
jgi:hypothetical protein